MRFKKLHIGLGALLIVVIGMSLTYSTLHSHHHISWDHPPEMADTGNCFTENETLCPICGYLFEPELPDDTGVEIQLFRTDSIAPLSEKNSPDIFTVRTLGRSPPLIG